MRKTLRFSKLFFPALIFSCVIIAFGVVGYVTRGFTLGVDFQAGLIQEIHLSPTAYNIRWTGNTNAIFSSDRNGTYIVISGSAIENQTYSFLYGEYATLGSLVSAMKQQLDELDVNIIANERINSQWLLTQGNTSLNTDGYLGIHYHDPQSATIEISEVRNAMAGFGGVSVQNIGDIQNRQFMIRAEHREDGRVTSDQILSVLESYFGKGEVAVLRFDYVDQRFSKDLTDQAGMLLGLTLLIILIYTSFRFKPKYALGAVIAIIHDMIVIVAFVVWTRMEFTTSTIAAILTILGYSINNTIVVFDRVRENRRIYPDNSFTDVLDISITGVLGRSIITTLTTILAILFLFIFAKGAMKDFALALIVGMISGVYTTLFIATSIVNFLENLKKKKV